jgi:hypothetical protein
VNVGVGGAHADTESGGDLRERVVLTQVHQCGQGTLRRWQLALAVTLASDDQHRHPLHKCMRDVEYGTIGNQRNPKAEELSLDTLLNSPGAPPVSQPPTRHPIGGHTENAQ